MEFKQMELTQEGSWFKRKFQSVHFKRSLLAIVIGAVVGFLLLFSEGRGMESMPAWDVAKSSSEAFSVSLSPMPTPCARGRC